MHQEPNLLIKICSGSISQKSQKTRSIKSSLHSRNCNKVPPIRWRQRKLPLLIRTTNAFWHLALFFCQFLCFKEEWKREISMQLKVRIQWVDMNSPFRSLEQDAANFKVDRWAKWNSPLTKSMKRQMLWQRRHFISVNNCTHKSWVLAWTRLLLKPSPFGPL